MSLVDETYILLAEKREGRSGSYGSVFPLFSDAALPDFLKAVFRFDDITLEPGASLGIHPGREGSCHFILPLAGGVDLLEGSDIVPVDNGSWLNIRDTPACPSRIYNPFDRPVNFLLIGYREEPQVDAPLLSGGKLVLDNRMVPVRTSPGFHLIVGCFSERESVEAALRSPGVLAYVIEGIFEVKDRLLQTRDALSVPDTLSLDFECFTPGGLVLFICDSIPRL